LSAPTNIGRLLPSLPSAVAYNLTYVPSSSKEVAPKASSNGC